MIKHIFFPVVLCLLFACTEKLDLKPDDSMKVPETIADFQALIDNGSIINANMPIFGEAGSDNYYITNTRYGALTQPTERNAYIWGKDIYPVNSIALDWAGGYTRINHCNLVLEGLEKISQTGEPAYDNLKGTALFLRAYSFFTLAEEFSKPYDSATAAVDPGIPLRVSTDVNKLYQRASVKDTYEKILADLTVATGLLPDIAAYKTRPSKSAALALLARIYLAMKNYQKALESADLSLAVYHDLLDYNQIEVTGELSFQLFNRDVIFFATASSTPLFRLNTTFVDSLLYKQYNENDLRKTLFFRQGTDGFKFVGSYSGNTLLQFGGIAVDEIYLIRAECYARAGDVSNAMKDVNTLLRTRWKQGTYTDMTATDPTDALEKVLTERRKELLFRGLRWTDLRRLNTDPRFATTITRVVNGKVYELPPNDPRYVYPIPDDEIRLSGIQQNAR